VRACCFFQLFRLFPISNRMGEKHRCARLHMASLNPLLLPRGGGIICTGGKSRNRYLCVLGGEAHDCRRTRGRNSGRAAMNCTAANRLACQVRTTRSRGVLQISPPPPPPLIARTRSRRVIDAFLRIPRGMVRGVLSHAETREFQAVQDNKRTTTSGARPTQTLKHPNTQTLSNC